MIITVDGYAASGKSSLAREVAKKLGFKHLDAGMLFRAVAYAKLKKIEQLDINFEDGKVYLNGEDISDEVRSRDVTDFVSVVGGSEEFRDLVYSIERRAAESYDLVASGRDTGTAVFPDAELKFFVKADLDVRAQRR